MTELSNSKLKLPRQDLETFTHFTPEPASAAAWLDELPLGNVAKSASSLRFALSDLNRLPLSPPCAST